MTITALISCLKNATSGTIELVEKNQIENKLATHSGLVLIDYSVFEKDEIPLIKQRVIPFREQHIFALFNAHDLTAKELASWPFIKGVFKKEDGLEHFCYGIEKLFLGEYWLPRHKLAELIYYHQQNSISSIDYSEICLTKREQQILRKLVTGASNCEIANGLFLSEHTVKSHLYNIFKKINVKNRVQAVFWAKNNLSIIGVDHLEFSL